MPDARYPAALDGPGLDVTDPRSLLLGYLEWYRAALRRKIDGLSEEALRTPVRPLGWSPLGLVRHLGWVERRWLRWGFMAEDVPYEPSGGPAAEWSVRDDESGESILRAYDDEVRRSQEIVEAHDLADPARTGGRFAADDPVPALGRILFHLLQEYARHVGHLDVARELVDGVTGE